MRNFQRNSCKTFWKNFWRTQSNMISLKICFLRCLFDFFFEEHLLPYAPGISKFWDNGKVHFFTGDRWINKMIRTGKRSYQNPNYPSTVIKAQNKKLDFLNKFSMKTAFDWRQSYLAPHYCEERVVNNI